MPRSVEEEDPQTQEEVSSSEESGEEDIPRKTASKPIAIKKHGSRAVKNQPLVAREAISVQPTAVKKKKPTTAHAPRATTTAVPQPKTQGAVKEVGVVHTKSGPHILYETAAKKYYVVSDGGSKTYVTARVLSGKLPLFKK